MALLALAAIILPQSALCAPLDYEAACEAVHRALVMGADQLPGIWEFPGAGLSVAILPADDGWRMEMTAVDSEIPAISPGKTIAIITPSPEAGIYNLVFKSSNPIQKIRGGNCIASLTKDNEGLTVKAPKLSLRINPLTLLPKFTSLLRVSLQLPVEKAPQGLIRIYPSYDGNGSSRRRPRTL